MRYLLDTHTFIWLDSDPDKVSATVTRLWHSNRDEFCIIVTSICEMQIKVQLGKLRLPSPLAEILQTQHEVNGLYFLPVNVKHDLALAELPLYHKDPFDRILIAQARPEDLVLVTNDDQLPAYPVAIVW